MLHLKEISLFVLIFGKLSIATVAIVQGKEHAIKASKSELSAQISKGVVYTNLGEDEEIKLFVSVPSSALASLSPDEEKLCRFSNNDRTIVINVTEAGLSVQVGSGDFSYFGRGVNEGECGLQIRNVTKEHISTWSCYFNAGGQIWSGSIPVLEYVRPEKPSIATPDYESYINVTDYQNETIICPISVSCCTLGGVPVEENRLSFYFGGVKVEDSVLKKNSSHPDRPITCIEWNATFTSVDNEKYLDCRISHPSLKNYPEDSEEINDSALVTVLYQPKIFRNNNSEFLTKQVFHNDKVDLYFTANGNPVPIFDLRMLQTTEGKDIQTKEVKVHGVQVHSDNNAHEFIVTIDAPKEAVTFEVTIENYLGRDVGVTIVSPQPGEKDSTFWILLVVGVVMSLIFIGIIVYFLNSAAEKRGVFCYKGRMGIYPVKKTAAKQNLEGDMEHEYSTVPRADTEY